MSLPAEADSWLALNRAELPPKLANRLLEHYRSPKAILQASPGELAHFRLTEQMIERLARADRARSADDLDRLAAMGVSLVTISDFGYPQLLRQIPDPPPLLFVRGGLVPEDSRAVALVGSRRASPYGMIVAESLSRELARRGVTVVSGLARGIDSSSHQGALAGGGRTLAVMGCGIDICYPRENADLMNRIIESGALISEFPPGASPGRERFPIRNRIISGLALGVVVVEAPERSGALITAGLAADQGRDVMAVPGSVESPLSKGSHDLIRDGARLVSRVEDILEEVNLEAAPAAAPAKPEPALSDQEDRLLSLLSLQQKYIDDLISESRLPAPQVNSGLMMLELKGLVRRLPGNLYVRLR